MSSRGGEQVYYLKLTSRPPSIVRELVSEHMVRVYTILIKYPVSNGSMSIQLHMLAYG
jgi:hypothetical protein